MDTRERDPIQFASTVPVIIKKCDHGDYCLDDDPSAVAIEWKSESDCVGSIITDAARDDFFKRVEAARKAGIPYIVVVGTTPDQIRQHTYFSRAHPESVLGRYDSLLSFGVPVLCASNRAHAAMIITDMLLRRAKHVGLITESDLERIRRNLTTPAKARLHKPSGR